MRLTIAQALVALAVEYDPELCQMLAKLGRPDLSSIFLPMPWLLWGAWFDRMPDGVALEARVYQLRDSLPVELTRRLKTRTWSLLLLPGDPRQGTKPFAKDQLAELSPANLAPKTSEVILGERHYRVRVEVHDRRPARPTFDRVKRRVEEALAQGHILWDDFNGMTEEALRARFHPESKKARNVVRAVRGVIRAERKP